MKDTNINNSRVGDIDSKYFGVVPDSVLVTIDTILEELYCKTREFEDKLSEGITMALFEEVKTQTVSILENEYPTEASEILRYVETVTECSTRSAGMEIIKPSALLCAKGQSLSSYQRRMRLLTARLLYAGVALSYSEIPLKERLKRVLHFPAFDANFSLGAVAPALCPICTGKGTIEFIRPDIDSFRFDCPDCNHTFTNNSIVDNFLTCTCNFCNSEKAHTLSKIRKVIAVASSDIFTSLLEWRRSLTYENETPDDLHLERNYLANQNSLGKDIEEILHLMPTDYEDFQRCIEHLNWNMSKKQQVLTKALTLGVIYDSVNHEVPDPNTFEECLMIGAKVFVNKSRYWFELWTFDRRSPKLADLIKLLLHDDNACERLEFARERIRFTTESGATGFIFNKNEYALLNSSDIKPSRSVVSMLNRFFVQNKRPTITSIEPPIHQAKSHPLFRSNAEINCFGKLCRENVGCLVVPNRKLHQIIDIKNISNGFKKEDIAYLRNCEIDFAVYDSRGNFLFAEELQRGDHHNDSDWIRKDKLKKDAFLVANLLLIWTF